MADFAAEGLLDGLEGQARAERVELLEWLLAEGFDLGAVRRAHDEGLLAFLAAEREVVGPRRYTAAEVEELSGVPQETMLRLMRAQGLPVREGPYTDVDLEAARNVRRLQEAGISDEQLLKIGRVAGRGLAQMAEVLRSIPLEHVIEPGVSEPDLARGYRDAVRGLMPPTGPLIEQMLRQHLLNMVRTEVVEAAERAAGELPGARDLAIGFADLVGFTRLGEEIPPDELGQVADRLTVIAGEVVQPPVRVVKTIGDAVMVVCPDPAPLVAASLALVEAIGQEGEDFPQVRVGVASGPTLSRGGDVFGSAVNLASRVTGIARAGSVLATREVRDAARERFSWSRAGTRKLKGLPEPVPLYRARAAAPKGA